MARLSLEPEVCIVGGGPVGSALALFLQRAGKRVLLLDAGHSKAKICGEGVLPAGWRVLEELGVSNEIENKAPIKHLSYRHFDLAGQLQTLQARLRLPAYGVERAHLCHCFAKQLEREAVEVWRGARFRSLDWGAQELRLQIDHPTRGRLTLKPELTVGADGLHSAVRRQAGLLSPEKPHYLRWGTRIYFESEPRAGVEVTLGEGLESYLTPLGGSLHGLAFLWSPQELGRPLPGEGPLWTRLFARFGSQYRSEFPSLEHFFGPERALGPLQQIVTTPLHPSQRVALVGDASGYLDALTGEGLCLGLQQARELSRLIAEGRLASYPQRYKRLKARHRVFVHSLLWLLRRPTLRGRVFAALEHSPELFGRMLGVAIEGRSPWGLLGPGLLRFVSALLRGH